MSFSAKRIISAVCAAAMLSAMLAFPASGDSFISEKAAEPAVVSVGATTVSASDFEITYYAVDAKGNKKQLFTTTGDKTIKVKASVVEKYFPKKNTAVKGDYNSLVTVKLNKKLGAKDALYLNTGFIKIELEGTKTAQSKAYYTSYPADRLFTSDQYTLDYERNFIHSSYTEGTDPNYIFSFDFSSDNLTYLTNLAACKCSLAVKTLTYDGTYKFPGEFVLDGSKELENGTDYKVTYKNNFKPGKAVVTITGIGDKYAGSQTLYFNIIPGKATLSSVGVSNKTSIKAIWKKDSLADGYVLDISPNKNFKTKQRFTINKNSTTSKVVSGNKKKTTYYVRVCAYKTIDGKKIFGPFSAVKKTKTK